MKGKKGRQHVGFKILCRRAYSVLVFRVGIVKFLKEYQMITFVTNNILYYYYHM